jgi:hypothetical protein
MANKARIIDGIAVDVSTEPAKHFHPSIAAEFVTVPAAVQPGWRLVDGTWSAPPAPEPQPEPEPAPALTWANAPEHYWWVSKGAFFDRFGAKGIQITSNTDPVVQGLITLLMPREYIDLRRPDLRPSIGVLVTKGLISQDECEAVLTTPTIDFERVVKGLPQPTA